MTSARTLRQTERAGLESFSLTISKQLRSSGPENLAHTVEHTRARSLTPMLWRSSSVVCTAPQPAATDDQPTLRIESSTHDSKSSR